MIISLVGYNGLMPTSYSSSSSETPNNTGVGAFDGYVYVSSADRFHKANPDALPISNFSPNWQSTSSWWYSAPNNVTNQWLQVNYGKKVDISGFRIFTLTSIGGYILNRLPKDVAIQYSDNGSSWTTAESLTLDYAHSAEYFLGTPIQAQYFRLYIYNNYGDASYIGINELEIF